MLHITDIKPLHTSLVTTGDKYTEDVYDGTFLVAQKGELKPYQTVIAKGNMVRSVEVGDQVWVNFMRYAVMQYDANSLKNDMGMNKVKEFRFRWVDLYDKDDQPHSCLFLDEQDIMYSFVGKEVDDKQTIILPDDKKIVL